MSLLTHRSALHLQSEWLSSSRKQPSTGARMTQPLPLMAPGSRRERRSHDPRGDRLGSLSVDGMISIGSKRGPRKRPHGFVPQPGGCPDRRADRRLSMWAAVSTNMARLYGVAAGVAGFQRAHQWQRLGDRGGPPAAPDRTPDGCRYADFECDLPPPPRARRARGSSRPPADRPQGRDCRLAS